MPAKRQQSLLQIDQWLDRRLDLDLDEAKLAAALDEAVDGRLRDAELIGDLRLGQAFEEMQDQCLMHLPRDRRSPRVERVTD